jgi:putative ABC transport system permease protein
MVIGLIIKNALRHKLRTALTVVGIAVAVMSFGFMRTVVTAWSYGVEASAANRMITRHSVSFIFPLPLSYRDQIARVPGVSHVTFANWFGGVYKDPNDWKNFFPRLAVDPETYFTVYPEFIVPPDQMEAFKRERNSFIAGEKLVREQGWKLGDLVTMEGDIYPGQWEFVLRGIYRGKDPTVDETQMLFQWKYLDETVAKFQATRASQVGWYIFTVDNPSGMPAVSRAVDGQYQNSRAGTKTETEKEFQQSFVSMSGAIITSLEVISYVIIGIILLVLANTIVMAARERTGEYAVLKTLGFSAFHVVGLILGESMMLAALGGLIGLALTFPVAAAFAKMFPTFFPVFAVAPETIAMAVGVALFAGTVAAVWPIHRTLRTTIVEGLRSIG